MPRQIATKILCILLLGSLALTSLGGAHANPKNPTPYTLESLEIKGSTRMNAEQLADELGLKPGVALNDELVMTTRTKLLSLGLFRSAILLMRKGSTPGQARLVIEVEDDTGVLSAWALGGELGVTMTDTSTSSSTATSASNDTAPMDYRVGLIGRNILSDLHRASLFVGFDDTGKFRDGQLAYGSPRFALEETQFDAEIAASSPSYRYLDTLGFGGRGQGLWSRTMSGYGELQYGAAMYVNKRPDFAVPEFPTSVAGPKFAYYRESRLHSFLPGEGELAGASLLLSTADTEKSVLEMQLAKTFALSTYALSTIDLKMLTIGLDGYALRAETRLDIPLGRVTPEEDQAALFVRLRGGQDRLASTKLTGSAAIIGVRYHSSGFIAELAFKFTRTPEDLDSDTQLKSSAAQPHSNNAAGYARGAR